jgi:hypothetical protein
MARNPLTFQETIRMYAFHPPTFGHCVEQDFHGRIYFSGKCAKPRKDRIKNEKILTKVY